MIIASAGTCDYRSGKRLRNVRRHHRRTVIVSVAAAIAVASAVAGISETCPDVLQLVADVVEDDHQRTVCDETALTAVAVVADEVVESAVSVLAVCLLSFNCTWIHFSHDAPNVRIVYNKDVRTESVWKGGLTSAL